jgi:chaperonin GroEL (HSP60 family)
MAATLATAAERTLAYARGSGDARDASIACSGANEKPQIGEVQFDCGYLSPFFVTDPERMEVAFDNAFVLFQQGKIASKKDLFPLLDQIAKTGKPLLIIAEDVEGAALATLVVQKVSGFLNVAAVRTPALGDQRKRWLHDVALLAGARQGLDTQLKNIQISDLGHATKVTIDKNSTVIENGTILHQLCSPVQPRSHPLADSSQHGNRHYSSTQPTTV